MRISSINVAQPKNLNYNLQRKNVIQKQPQMQVQEPSFKGWKTSAAGTIGGILGAGAATVLTGGLGAILIGGMFGTFGGVLGGSAIDDDTPDDYDY